MSEAGNRKHGTRNRKVKPGNLAGCPIHSPPLGEWVGKHKSQCNQFVRSGNYSLNPIP